MIEVVATWSSQYKILCEVCDVRYSEGVVTDDQRMRCPKRHDSLSPGPTAADVDDALDELADYAELGILQQPCPRCGDSIERIMVSPGNDSDHTATFIDMQCRAGHALTW